ncbi:MAG: hypothetical protein HND58_17230 [Planctomycetota bacterium]|nr:MAG: hypothetical protein HND58_17230 [Planctomycetota bacterium]
MRHCLLAAVAVCMALASTAHADLLVADFLNSRILRFSQSDGSLIDANFIQLQPNEVPFDMTRVRDEIWISDIANRQIIRYSLDGQARFGAITGLSGAADGLEYVPEQDAVFVATGRGSGHAVDRVHPDTHTITGSFPVFDALDVLDADGSLLLTNVSAGRIDRYGYDGTYLGVFADAEGDTGLETPFQFIGQPDGSLYVGFGGSGPEPGGIAEYSSSGDILDVWQSPTDGFVGIGALENGKFLVTLNSGGRVAIFDPAIGTLTPVGPDDVLAFFVSPVVIPTPGPAPLLGIAVIVAVRRRR